MDLANRVRQRREELGMSQEDLALRMGYSSRTSINKIENGRPCSQKIIARLAEALGVSIPYLMGWLSDEQQEVQKGKPTAQGNGLTDGHRKLIEFAQSLSEDQAVLALRLLKSLVEAD